MCDCNATVNSRILMRCLAMEVYGCQVSPIKLENLPFYVGRHRYGTYT